MTDVHSLSIYLAKHSFQVCATALGGAVLSFPTVSRAKPVATFRPRKSPDTRAIEAPAPSERQKITLQNRGIHTRTGIVRGSNSREGGACMSKRPNKYSPEVCARAVRFMSPIAPTPFRVANGGIHSII